MQIKDVDHVQIHPSAALIELAQDVVAPAAASVSRLGRDDKPFAILT